MINQLLDWAFGCRHRRTTFPRSRSVPRRRQVYVVCLDCGREFLYDWARMRRLPAVACKAPKISPKTITTIKGVH
jgi:DNA-directed RNA polymerase subunit RPC12/RpoP